MTPQEFQTYLNHRQMEIALQGRIADAMDRLVILLERMLPAKAPDVVLDISEFATFDFSSIGAVVVQSDEEGPTVVNWRGQPFFRRSPNNKFAAAIWFSRCTGKDERGENTYERLCTFKALNHRSVDELPDKVRAATRS